ncbi:hypothetical protein ACH4YO_33545 [Streptomyces noursei]|uniref:hypothetical protein n=1 Tax=Streptomyces noursei TaxID=1971 RepID=UPI0037972C27
MDSHNDQSPQQSSVDAPAQPVPTHTLGLTSAFTDPLWRMSVCLSPVEIDLRRTEPLRRLHFVAHGGASTISTLQSYSGAGPGWDFALRKIYSSAPLVEGQRIEVAAPELAAELAALGSLSTDFRVRWS